MVASQVQPIAESREHSGGLLLSLGENVIFSLNESALVVWVEIERHREGMSRDQIMDYLQDYYAGMVPRSRLQEDVTSLTDRFSKRGFLTRLTVNDDEPNYRIKDDVFRTVEDKIPAPGGKGADSAMSYCPGDHPRASRFKAIKDSCLGFAALVIYEVILRLRGFGQVCVLVEQWPVAKARVWSPVDVRQVCAAVDRARLWYPKKVLCLQHSAIVTCLLRNRGVPARMMFAARRKPFYAHAWCEVEGTVVNDEQSVRNRYSRFIRCLRSPSPIDSTTGRGKVT